MKADRRGVAVALTLALFTSASLARAAVVPVTGWMVHNGTATAGGTASNPVFTPGDNITVMAPFADVVLVNDGDFVEGKTTLTMNTRSTTGINTLNTQLRIALLGTTNASLAAGDSNNLGFIIEYTNQAAGGLIREQTVASQTNPFTSPTTLGNGVQDTGADSIQGANPGPVTFTLRLTRNAGKLDLLGSIIGADTVSTNPYSASYTLAGITATNFTFNRLALFVGDNVNAATASMADSSISTVPEPASWAAAVLAVGGALLTRRAWRVAHSGNE